MTLGNKPLKYLLVTDAYSASNIGDLELVRLSVEYANLTYPNLEVCCLAVDAESFQIALKTPTQERLFPRVTFIKANKIMKLCLAVKWVIWILVLSLLTLPPRFISQKIITTLVNVKLLPRIILLYLGATRIIAVGGGYLGDQYQKETVLTVWTWWWASRMGVPAETMPLSVEVDKAPLRYLLRTFGNRVHWRVRDRSSEVALKKCGIESRLVPDLAFSNYRVSNRPRNGTLIALVGSDYLSPQEQQASLDNVTALFEEGLLPLPAKVVAMHAPMSDTEIGGDLRMSERLKDQLVTIGVEKVDIYSASTFSKVCEIAESAETTLSARMHAGIAGLCGGTKVGLLAYEEKHIALMYDLGLSKFAMDIRGSKQDYRDLAIRLRDEMPEPFQKAAAEYLDQLEREGLTSK